MTLGAVAVLAAAFVKGAIGFGFPTLATPLLTLFIDVKTAVAVLILPNIVMDALQFRRRGAPAATMRRFAWLLVFGALGTVLGTRVLVTLSASAATLALAAVLLLFVAGSAARVSPRVPAGWEWWLSPAVGLIAGVVGGVTNVPGTPLAMYFYALRLPKHEFVQSIAFTFLVYKTIQLGAVAYYGLLTWTSLGVAVGLTAVALAGFAVGLRVQDRLAPAAFDRAVLAFLAALGVWLLARTLW
ncbi:MAG: TSUP family transporter [Candidatus Rokuibacteriota bacterium]